MKSNLDKYLILSGFIGAVIFFLAIAVMGALYPGYDHVTQTISELGAPESPVHVLMNVFGFGLFGVFIMLFAVGIFRSTELGKAGKLAAVVFFITGFMMFLVAVFPTYADLGFITPNEMHEVVANYQFPVLTVALLLFALDVRNHKRLRLLTPTILAMGSITLVLAYFTLLTWPPLLPIGIIQRLSIGLAYTMVAIISMRSYQVQTNAPVRRWLLGAAIVVLIAIAIAAPQQLEINESRADLPTLQGLCYGEQGCIEFCHDNFGGCTEVCNQEPENPLCMKVFGVR